MGHYLKSHLISLTSDKVEYWVCSGLDEKHGEQAIIPLHNPDAAHTIGFDRLQTWSRVMMSRAWHTFETTGQWPDHDVLCS
jgi:hypothetical protein